MYFMQIDAHTDFREGWDSNLIQQIKRTPSYPNSVISNYPPSGNPFSTSPWPRDTFEKARGSSAPTGLCSCSFETIPSSSKKTVRLAHTFRRFKHQSDDEWRPRHTGFVAAGFFFSHGSLVQKATFDPFLPYIFMGEEIVMSIRFWTAGFDIYGPSSDVLAHWYVRQEAPKFWESVNMIYSNGAIHNALTDLLLPRIQHLVGYPEAKREDQVHPKSLLTRFSQFGLGTKRKGADFIELMGFDLDKKTQRTPQWCTSGDLAPIVAKPGSDDDSTKSDEVSADRGHAMYT
jgi:hypothetical protein